MPQQAVITSFILRFLCFFKKLGRNIHKFYKTDQLKPRVDFKIVDWKNTAIMHEAASRQAVRLLPVPQNTHETEEEPSVLCLQCS